MKEITGDMLIKEIMEKDIKVVDILVSHGLNCLGCPASATESLSEAAKGHGVNLEKLIHELNDYFDTK